MTPKNTKKRWNLQRDFQRGRRIWLGSHRCFSVSAKFCKVPKRSKKYMNLQRVLMHGRNNFQRGRKKIRCKFHNFRCKKWLRKRQKKDKIYNGIFSVAGVWLRKQHTTTETILDDFCGQEKTAKLKKYCFSRWKWPSRCKFCCPQKNPVVKKSFFFESKKRAVSKCH